MIKEVMKRIFKRKCRSVYSVILDLPEHHCRFSTNRRGGYVSLLRFDLKNRTIRNGNTHIIKNGIVSEKLELTDGTVYEIGKLPLFTGKELKEYGIDNMFDNPYEVIVSLYAIDEYSRPTEKSVHSKCNFIAKKSDELTLTQMKDNVDRITAQYMLEAYIMLMSMEGRIPWENENHHYWQSKRHRDLFIFKEWVA